MTIEIILYLALITFGTLIGSAILAIRKLEIENKKLRKTNSLDLVIEKAAWNLLEK
jgi:hypothetical protein